MAEQTVIPITKAGLDNLAFWVVAAEAGGDSVATSSGIFIAILNGAVGALTLTVTAPVASTNCGSYGSLLVDDIVQTVEPGETALLAIPQGYSDNGQLSWTYSDHTDIGIGVFSISP